MVLWAITAKWHRLINILTQRKDEHCKINLKFRHQSSKILEGLPGDDRIHTGTIYPHWNILSLTGITDDTGCDSTIFPYTMDIGKRIATKMKLLRKGLAMAKGEYVMFVYRMVI